jgi:hypothetical protein
MGHKRETFRIHVHLTGSVSQGARTAACEVVELTEKGIRLRTDLPVSAGDELTLELLIPASSSIQGTVSVTHVKPPYLGGRFRVSSPKHQRLLSQFIEQIVTMNLAGF